MRVGVPLFTSQEEDRYFSNRPPELKDELQVFVKEVLLAQEVNTPDSRRKVGMLLENWSIELMQPQWTDFKELAERFTEDKQLLSGDFRRRCIQILEALK